MMKKTRIRLKDRTAENDIAYRGILSYRHVRILAWIFLAFSQLTIILKVHTSLRSDAAGSLAWLSTMASFCSNLPLPLFLLANIAVILQKRNDYKSLLLTYGGMALGMYALANVLVFHYGYGVIHAFSAETTLGGTAQLFGGILSSLGTNGYALNIFIDLFLFALAFFFLNYKPKKRFQGKKIVFFRLLVLIPILYETASVIIKYLIGANGLAVPSYVFFLLTNKPPMMFLAFLILVIILKGREVRQTRRHSSEDWLEDHLETNANSLRVSILISVVFLICSVADLLVMFIIMMAHAAKQGYVDAALAEGIQIAVNLGFGSSMVLLFAIPVVMLFSYNKTYKNRRADTYVSVGGVALVAFVLLEGFFLVLTNDLPYFLQNWLEGSGGEEAVGALTVLRSVVGI